MTIYNVGKQNVILVFDIGKTNKKVLLFDELYNIIYEEAIQLAETRDENGFPCENINALTNWIQQKFAGILFKKNVEVRAVNFCAYGASFVHVNSGFKKITPLYNYLKPYPEKLRQQFYLTYGDENVIAEQTASPALGSLNSGMQLYRLKYDQPKIYEQIKYSLHLPQYLSFLITQKATSDITSIGCHTQLWNFQKNNYHDWVRKEKVDKKLALIYKTDKTFPVHNTNKSMIAGIGLHDSSAALIPYLITIEKPFVLISTGTWCISLNPFNHTPLTGNELKKDCLCYLNYKGKPVKASRLFAGYEHENATKKLAAHFNKQVDYYKTIRYDASLSTKIKNEQVEKPGAVDFVETGLYNSYEEAYHGLICSLIKKQAASTSLILNNSPVKEIFVDGGFSANEIYMQMLADTFSDKQVYSTNIQKASALGAALVIHEHWNKISIPANLINLKKYQRQKV